MRESFVHNVAPSSAVAAGVQKAHIICADPVEEHGGFPRDSCINATHLCTVDICVVRIRVSS